MVELQDLIHCKPSPNLTQPQPQRTLACTLTKARDHLLERLRYPPELAARGYVESKAGMAGRTEA